LIAGLVLVLALEEACVVPVALELEDPEDPQPLTSSTPPQASRAPSPLLISRDPICGVPRWARSHTAPVPTS
jgi:hypothetical protein